MLGRGQQDERARFRLLGVRLVAADLAADLEAGEEGGAVTPAQDSILRRRAQRAFDFATAELARTDDPPIKYGEGDWEEQVAREKAWHATAAYAQLREYRSWLYDVKHAAEYRRRHPIVRLIRRSRSIGPRYYPKYSEAEMLARFGRRYEDSPLNLPAEREPSYALRWYWIDDNERDGQRRTHAPVWAWGDTLALGLPILSHAGRAIFHANHDTWSWEIGWSLGPRVWSARHLGFAISIDGEDRDINARLLLPLIGSLYLILNHMAPVWLTFPKERRYTTYEPYVFPAGYEIQPGDRKPVEHRYMMGQDLTVVELDISSDHASGALWSIGEHMQSEGKRRFYTFWPDRIFGRPTCTTGKVGEPVQAVACFPEGQYTLTLQREVRTWTRSRWPWPYWRKSVNITVEKPPGFQGKGENSYDCGPDAIYGTSSEGHSFEDAVATYVKAVLRERAKRGHLEPQHRSVLTGALS